MSENGQCQFSLKSKLTLLVSTAPLIYSLHCFKKNLGGRLVKQEFIDPGACGEGNKWWEVLGLASPVLVGPHYACVLCATMLIEGQTSRVWLSPALSRWIGKNVNVPCSVWQLLLCSGDIQTDNHYGLIYFRVPCSWVYPKHRNMQTADVS